MIANRKILGIALVGVFVALIISGAVVFQRAEQSDQKSVLGSLRFDDYRHYQPLLEALTVAFPRGTEKSVVDKILTSEKGIASREVQEGTLYESPVRKKPFLNIGTGPQMCSGVYSFIFVYEGREKRLMKIKAKSTC